MSINEIKRRLLEATVIDQVGPLISVRLSNGGAVFNGIECVGSVSVGDRVWVDIARPKPLAFSSAGVELVQAYVEKGNVVVYQSGAQITGLETYDGSAPFNADTVDGYHASGTPEPNSLYPLNANGVFDPEVYPAAFLIDGSRKMIGPISFPSGQVYPIDGIYVSTHNHSGAAGMGQRISHTDLLNTAIGNPHSQYPLREGSIQTITAPWLFSGSSSSLLITNGTIVGGSEQSPTLVLTDKSLSVGLVDIANNAIDIGDVVLDSSGLRLGNYKFDTNGVLIVGSISSTTINNSGSLISGSASLGRLDISTVLTVDPLQGEPFQFKIGGTPLVTIDPSGNLKAPRVLVDGAVMSSNFQTGLSGFYIDASGYGEFETLKARGSFKTVVFEKEHVSVSSGKIVVSVGDLLEDDLPANSNTIVVRNKIFSPGDYLVIKAVDNSGGVSTEYLQVSAYLGTERRDYDVYKYSVVRNLNNNNPVPSWPRGTTITAIGASSYAVPQRPLAGEQLGDEYGEFTPGGTIAALSGGFLEIDGTYSGIDGTSGVGGVGPFFGVVRRSGSLYSDLRRIVKIGYIADIPYVGANSDPESQWGLFVGNERSYMYFSERDGLVLYSYDSVSGQYLRISGRKLHVTNIYGWHVDPNQYGNLSINATTVSFSNDVSISGALSAGSISTSGNLSTSSLSVSGNASIGGTLTTSSTINVPSSGATISNGDITISKNLTVNGTLLYSASGITVETKNNHSLGGKTIAGTRFMWDTDYAFIGLADYGSNRKDAVLVYADDTSDYFRLQFYNNSNSTLTDTLLSGGDTYIRIPTRLRVGDSNAPSNAFEVNGNASISGNLTVSGTLTPSGGLSSGSVSESALASGTRRFAITVIVGDGQQAITTGVKATVRLPPFQFNITGWEIVSVDSTTGSITFDVRVNTLSGTPAGSGSSICGSNKPVMSNAVRSSGNTNGWSLPISANRWATINVDSASSVKLVALTLICTN